jgi:4-aminobutyrate aminotransferase-like enzyme
MAKWKPGSHGGTYGGGSAISAAAALATVETILDEHLVENAAARGDQLMQGLFDLKRKYPVIGDVRGLGLMVATEFTKDGKPDLVTTKAVQNECLANNLLLLTCGTYENVIRWIPPLIVSKEQIDEALNTFDRAVAKVISK